MDKFDLALIAIGFIIGLPIGVLLLNFYFSYNMHKIAKDFMKKIDSMRDRKCSCPNPSPEPKLDEEDLYDVK